VNVLFADVASLRLALVLPISRHVLLALLLFIKQTAP
jgi:hypothetical protein